MSETDSFIEEVNEEVRRDRLFAIFRKYGWIPITAILLIVGAAAYNEWRKATELRDAQNLGDAVLAALLADDPGSRAEALDQVSTQSEQSTIYIEMLRAAAETEADNKDAALKILDRIAADPKATSTFRDLAALKALMLRGADQDKAARLAGLERLSAAGAPFRVFAMEQNAMALFEYGDNDGAIAILRLILDEPGATQGLIQRSQQLIVALGGELSTDGDAASDK